MTDLSVVIATRDGWHVLGPCLAALEEASAASGLAVEVFVVDNGSADGTPARVAEVHPWVELIALGVNEGFAAANNRALAKRRGRHALLLNNDARIGADALRDCVAYLDAHPDVAIVGPQLTDAGGALQNSIHATPRIATEVVPKGLLETLWPGRYPSKRRAHRGALDVEAVLGACLFVRGEAIEAVGPLPEAYFFFLEETDWCLAMREAGWRVVHLADVRVEHAGGASVNAMPLAKRIEYHRSLYRFFARRRGPAAHAFVVAWRFAKSCLYVGFGALPALFSSGSRARWKRDCAVLRWHLLGCPDEGWGLPREASAGHRERGGAS